MKIRFVFSLLLFAFCTSNVSNGQKKIIERVENDIKIGHFNEARTKIYKYIGENSPSNLLIDSLLDKIELMKRIEHEFTLTEKQVTTKLAEFYPELNAQQLRTWEKNNVLEMRLINNERRYFKRAVSNLFLIDPQAAKVRSAKYGASTDNVGDFCKRYIPSLIEKRNDLGLPFDSKKIKISYSITLPANTLPENEIVRCWLPFPKATSNFLKISNFKTPEKKYILSNDSNLHSSLYIEKQTIANKPLVFSYECEIETAAKYYDLSKLAIVPYDTNSQLYKDYTKEELPHIILSENIKKLARQIVGAETNPYNQVKLLYYWINDHIPWASALEYSVFECIPEYVLAHSKGDCGMQTFLFLSLARSLNIPCKWQSGWYLLPEEINMHDWAEVYYQEIGWVPLDASFKLIENNNNRVKEFYITGLDSYRMIVNDGISLPFFPAKIFKRSEPFDFQRGELEWRGGNLYFDKWDYDINIEYLPN